MLELCCTDSSPACPVTVPIGCPYTCCLEHTQWLVVNAIIQLRRASVLHLLIEQFIAARLCLTISRRWGRSQGRSVKEPSSSCYNAAWLLSAATSQAVTEHIPSACSDVGAKLCIALPSIAAGLPWPIERHLPCRPWPACQTPQGVLTTVGGCEERDAGQVQKA